MSQMDKNQTDFDRENYYYFFKIFEGRVVNKSLKNYPTYWQ